MGSIRLRRRVAVAALLAATLLLVGYGAFCGLSIRVYQSQGVVLRLTRTVLPLPDPPDIACVLRVPFDAAAGLGNTNAFVFRGAIRSLHEVEVSWYRIGQEGAEPQYLTVCHAEVTKVYTGDAKGEGETVRLLSYQSSRMLPDDEFRLEQGKTYCFVTHAFDANDRNEYLRKDYAQLRPDLLADVQLDSALYDLMPMAEKTVRYYFEWPIGDDDGHSRWSEPPTEDSNDLAQLTRSADREVFEERFAALVAGYQAH